MLITDLSEKVILDFMTRAHLARLACAKDGQPYIAPIFCAYENGCVYCASTEGKKIEWMRANPLVCVEVYEVDSPQHWTSVVIDGRFEEIPNSSSGRSGGNRRMWKRSSTGTKKHFIRCISVSTSRTSQVVGAWKNNAVPRNREKPTRTSPLS